MSRSNGSIERLTEQMGREKAQKPEFTFPVEFDLASLVAIAANLQLALRHPGNSGASARVARSFVDGVIEMLEVNGFSAHAELVRRGDKPEFDE